MTRYKGRTKTKLVERDFPHHVEMMVPEFGFGAHLDAMYDWHHARGVLALLLARREWPLPWLSDDPRPLRLRRPLNTQAEQLFGLNHTANPPKAPLTF